MSPRKPTRSEPPPDRIAANTCARVTKTGGKHPTPKASKPIQGLVPLSVDAKAKLAILKPQLQAKRVSVISGAGTSVNAGIPDFQDLRKSNSSPFDVSAYNSPRETGYLHALIHSISRLSAQARPTLFYEFLNSFACEGRLLRHYTQNIDCIELQLYDLWGKIVQLHGRVDQARCQLCNWIISFTAKMFCGSDMPNCPRYQDISMERERKGKRPSSIGKLRPTMVLYGEEHPNGESIGQTAESDIRKGPDLVLVVGTCLKVPEARRLARELCNAAKTRGGMAVWINKEAPPSASTLLLIWQFWAIAMVVLLCFLSHLRIWTCQVKADEDTMLNVLGEAC